MISYIVAEFFVLLMLLLLLINTETSLGRQRQIYCFRMMLAADILAMLCDIICDLGSLNGITEESILYRVSLLGSYFFTTYSFMHGTNFIATTLRFKWENSRIWDVVIRIPLVLMFGALITPFYREVLRQEPGGPLVVDTGEALMVGIDCLYLIIVVMITLQSQSAIHRKAERRIYQAICWYVAFLALGELMAVLLGDAPGFELSLVPGTFILYSSLMMSQVNTDALTGLNNRRKIDDFMENTLPVSSEEHAVELFLFDLDYFKSVNDILGHHEGDRVLQAFAEAMRRTARKRGTVLGRFGGDEFVLGTASGWREPEHVRRTLRQKLDEVCVEEGIKYKISFSMGYAVSTIPGITEAELLKRADIDLYKEKDAHHLQLAGFEETLKKIKAGN